MATQTEGTFVLDGLIEGCLPADAGAPARLRDWVKAVRHLGLEIQLELDGGGFSLLADESRVAVATIGPAPADRVREAVEQLVHSFPDLAAAALFSTLRSVEIRPGTEVQTVYVIRPDGSVEAPERVLDATTSPPPAPASARDWVKVGILSVVVAAALFGVTSLFVDWRGAVESFWNKVVPFDAAEVVVDSHYEHFFLVVGRKRESGGKALLLELERTDAFPLDEKAILELRETTGRISTRGRLALDALARGYVRAEIFGEDGTFLGFTDVRVAELRVKTKITIEVRVPRDPRPARIVLTY